MSERRPADPPVLTVSQVTRLVKDAIETDFPYVWVVGEVSNCTRAASGHVYLTLKDDASQLRAVVWRSKAARLRFEVHDGLEVVAAGPLEVYQARGTFQLTVDRMQPEGVGPLELAFRQMQEKLAAEGLFDPDRKRPLPAFPRRIALVTSPTGAAVGDMLQVVSRRWRAVDVVILPVRVQGEGAAAEIAAALESVARIPDVDVVIAGRGGGSLEDLWAFNEEVVARAIAACPLPVISAVGHEIDVTIADLVADRRALTPSEAAELAVPRATEVQQTLSNMKSRLTSALREQARRRRLELDSIATRGVFARPYGRVQELTARLDETAARLPRAARLKIERESERVSALAAQLDALSPLNILARGYSITRRMSDDAIVKDAGQLAPGDQIKTRYHLGTSISRVESVNSYES